MRVGIRETRWIEVKKAARERIAKAEAEHLCAACMQPLDNTRTIRGCHQRCHKATFRAIERGLTTEAQRVAEGKLLEAQDGGRKPNNPVTLELQGS